MVLDIPNVLTLYVVKEKIALLPAERGRNGFEELLLVIWPLLI